MSRAVRHQPNILKDVPGNSFLEKNSSLKMLEDEKLFNFFSISKHLRRLSKITENETVRFFRKSKSNSSTVSLSLSFVRFSSNQRIEILCKKKWLACGVPQSCREI